MSEQKPSAPQSSGNPAVFKTLPDGTVLYQSYREAEQAARQNKVVKVTSAAAKPGQAKLGEIYLAKDGQPHSSTLGGLMEFQFTGLIVVMVVLLSLYLICAGIGRLLRGVQRAFASRSVSVPSAPLTTLTPAAPNPLTSGIHPGLTDQQLAVILTAAAQEAVGGPVRVERFRPLTDRDLDWAAKGRRDLQSHQLK